MPLKMLILFMLLAMVATTHARLDAFQMLTSKNRAISNSEVAEVHTKSGLIPAQGKSGLIPYPVCIQICDDCACTRIWPIEKAMCFCINNTDAKRPPSIQSSGQVELSNTKAKSELIPYWECQKTCKVSCACTLIWPPEKSMCVCGDPIKSSTKRLAIPSSEVEFHTKGKSDLIPAGEKSGTIPYPICIQICDDCACTRIWPIELAICFCINNTDSNPKKPAIQNLAKQGELVSTKAKSDLIPYEECVSTCELCACTLIWPPEKSMCICADPKPSTTEAGNGINAFPVQMN